ncbi:branched-chain-amino-acid aminotransferase 2, chloroplastic-like isoform X1 [Chenopodium quinoa]|uniref:branched-chain-amino-acid aminotransferase 2, chloroplastic-like isoform X1 n=1 Tax=Chenopodium quinoa TaxID=63459 RepID=UPI000B77AF2F|nr:branched-chain-amino-acid aminotransferase 2, chloroplastic-like isoform X1 [Chenopodium quinoa]
MASVSSSISSGLRTLSRGDENGYVDIDWDTLGFGLTSTDYMYKMKCFKDEEFAEGKLIPYGNIELSPAACVLNYGQGIFEGMKATRRENGKIVFFRPDGNALRMKKGAERMCMPSPSVDQFIDAVKQTALANKRWIPPPGKGSLYIRPLLLGTGATPSVAPATEYTFLIYASPVRNNYFKGMKPLTKAKNNGYSDVLYLDSVTGKYVEEVSACNIFIVKDKIISTPPTKGTILPGVTRKSMIEIARDQGFKVEERQIAVEELLEADEAFCTGTAVAVVPVGSITYQGKRVEYRAADTNSMFKKLLSIYVGIQNGQIEDKKGWIVEIN